MKIRVLGCSGAEVQNANLTGFLVDGKMLLDGGTIGASLSTKEQWKIRHVMVTHAHLDHTKGIPFLADNIVMSNRKHHITLVSKLRVLHAMRRSLLNNIVWPDFTKIPTPENAVVKFKLIGPGIPLKVDSYTVTAYDVNHGIPAVGFLIEDRKGKRLLYTGDTGPTEAIWNGVRGTRVHGLIVEVSFPNRFKELALGTGHLTPALLRGELKKLGELPDRIFITHFKPRYRDTIQKELSGIGVNDIEILKDGDVIAL